MKKRKTYEISVIDKTYSKTISDETKFYTSDTALELVFKLKETEYNFESAEIVLLNIDDRSLVTRPVTKVDKDFVYELDDDITAHYGEWHGQIRFEQAGEIYVSSPVKFRIENDLSNDRPPQLSDVQSWVNLKRYADKLTDELKQAVLEVEGMDDTFNANELERQSTFEANESERNQTFESNEAIRQTQEIEREKAEANRQTTFENNETGRFETFNTNEVTRQENETSRQQAEGQRQSTFENNEIERQNTFETAEQGRKSAELIRVENEEQRNLTSVDEFIKLQNAFGGRNLLLNSSYIPYAQGTEVEYKGNLATKIKSSTRTNYSQYVIEASEDLIKGETYTYSTLVAFEGEKPESIQFYLSPLSNYTNVDGFEDLEEGKYGRVYITRKASRDGSISRPHLNINGGDGYVYFTKWQLEEGSFKTPYTKAPEDYTMVSKDDYYNHVKLMTEFKDSQFNQLRKAVITLGGTI